MNPRLLELALVKRRLTLRSGALRREFADAAGAWAPALQFGDRLRRGVDWLRRHPSLLVAASVALLVARPRTVFKLASRGWMAWRTLASLGAGLRRMQSLGVSVERDRKAGAAGARDHRGSL